MTYLKSEPYTPLPASAPAGSGSSRHGGRQGAIGVYPGCIGGATVYPWVPGVSHSTATVENTRIQHRTAGFVCFIYNNPWIRRDSLLDSRYIIYESYEFDTLVSDSEVDTGADSCLYIGFLIGLNWSKPSDPATRIYPMSDFRIYFPRRAHKMTVLIGYR